MDMTNLENELLITTKQLQKLLNCGPKTAAAFGNNAKARIKMGSRVFWNTEKIRRFINENSGK